MQAWCERHPASVVIAMHETAPDGRCQSLSPTAARQWSERHPAGTMAKSCSLRVLNSSLVPYSRPPPSAVMSSVESLSPLALRRVSPSSPLSPLSLRTLSPTPYLPVSPLASGPASDSLAAVRVGRRGAASAFHTPVRSPVTFTDDPALSQGVVPIVTPQAPLVVIRSPPHVYCRPPAAATARRDVYRQVTVTTEFYQSDSRVSGPGLGVTSSGDATEIDNVSCDEEVSTYNSRAARGVLAGLENTVGSAPMLHVAMREQTTSVDVMTVQDTVMETSTSSLTVDGNITIRYGGEGQEEDSTEQELEVFASRDSGSLSRSPSPPPLPPAPQWSPEGSPPPPVPPSPRWLHSESVSPAPLPPFPPMRSHRSFVERMESLFASLSDDGEGGGSPSPPPLPPPPAPSGTSAWVGEYPQLGADRESAVDSMAAAVETVRSRSTYNVEHVELVMRFGPLPALTLAEIRSGAQRQVCGLESRPVVEKENTEGSVELQHKAVTPSDRIQETPFDQINDTTSDQVEDTSSDQIQDTPSDQIKGTPSEEIQDNQSEETKDAPSDWSKDTRSIQIKDIQDTPSDQIQDTSSDQSQDTSSDQSQDPLPTSSPGPRTMGVVKTEKMSELEPTSKPVIGEGQPAAKIDSRDPTSSEEIRDMSAMMSSSQCELLVDFGAEQLVQVAVPYVLRLPFVVLIHCMCCGELWAGEDKG